MGWKFSNVSNADESGISLFDIAASSCVGETAAEVVRVSAWGGLAERSEPVIGSAVLDDAPPFQ